MQLAVQLASIGDNVDVADVLAVMHNGLLDADGLAAHLVARAMPIAKLVGGGLAIDGDAGWAHITGRISGKKLPAADRDSGVENVWFYMQGG